MDEADKETDLKRKLNKQARVTAATGVPAVDADMLAKSFVSLIPHMMGSLRRHLRTAEGGDLRVGQFRMMMAIALSPELSISNAAEVMGLTLPSASKVADELARAGLVQRKEDRRDRRRSLLSLTPAGFAVLETVQRAAEDHFANIFQPLTAMERVFLLCAAETLRPLFRPGVRPNA
jgi:DNA-binding MarR family transcriptional regulator